MSDKTLEEMAQLYIKLNELEQKARGTFQDLNEERKLAKETITYLGKVSEATKSLFGKIERVNEKFKKDVNLHDEYLRDGIKDSIAGWANKKLEVFEEHLHTQLILTMNSATRDFLNQLVRRVANDLTDLVLLDEAKIDPRNLDAQAFKALIALQSAIRQSSNGSDSSEYPEQKQPDGSAQ